SGLDRLLRGGRPRLCELLAVPGADRAPGRRAGRTRGTREGPVDGPGLRLRPGNRHLPRLLRARTATGRTAMSDPNATPEFEGGAERAARRQREIQGGIDAKEQRSFAPERKAGAMQAGARRYPEPPFPEQHQEKPGVEIGRAHV